MSDIRVGRREVNEVRTAWDDVNKLLVLAEIGLRAKKMLEDAEATQIGHGDEDLQWWIEGLRDVVHGGPT